MTNKLVGKGAIFEAEAFDLLTDVGISVKVAAEDVWELKCISNFRGLRL
jgi:hypothetical protein